MIKNVVILILLILLGICGYFWWVAPQKEALETTRQIEEKNSRQPNVRVKATPAPDTKYIPPGTIMEDGTI